MNKSLNEMTLEELYTEMNGRSQDALYSEILSPKTEADKAHNQKLSDAFNEVREIILTKEKERLLSEV